MSIALVTALSFALLLQSPAGSPSEVPARRPVVVESSDPALRERLALAGELWHDAGEFVVGALDPAAVAALRARGLAVSTLDALGVHDELFLADLSHTDVRRDIDAAGAVHFRRGQLALVGVPVGLSQYPENLQPGRMCQPGLTAVPRRAMKRAPAASWNGVPAGTGPAALLAADPRIQALVNQVSKSNIEAAVQSYSSFTNRDSKNLANYNAARAQLVAQLQSWGYAPVSETWDATHGPNVYVERIGARNPNRFVVVGAHFDTRNYSGGVSAVSPGADDNTSGSAAVLELARVLAGAGAFENSVRLMWFSGEEYGLLGSAAHANAMAAQGKQVAGMLNMDMIAYRAAGDVRDCDFVTNNSSATLIAFCQQVAPLYVTGWASTTGSLGGGSSDHAAFAAAGFPAVFFFEDASQYCPVIHTVNDAYPSATPDFDLALMIAQGALASAATLAEPADLAIVHSELPDTTDAGGPYPVSAQVSSLYGSTVTGATLYYRARGAVAWTSTAMALSGGSWNAAIPALGTPLFIEYYIEAVDDQGASEIAPEGADLGGQPYDFFVGTRTVVYATGFEEATDAGWTHGQIATQDDWQRGAPMGLSGDPGGAFAGTRAWGNDLGPSGWNGAYANNVHNWLRSPVIDCSGASSVSLSFRRWLTVESSQFDKARILVNGAQVWINPSTGDLLDGSWVPFELDISAFAAGNAAVQIEFRLQSDGGVAFGGWTIDDFSLVELGPGVIPCPPATTYCTAKQNSAGCLALSSTAGTASASSALPFTISASQVVNQKNGVLFYSSQAVSVPFQGGVRCVAQPFRRTAMAFSGGNSGVNDCSGVLSLDFNAWIRSGIDPALVPGADVYAQWWYRDGADPMGFGSGLSDAVSLRVCP